jgi:putative transposase
MKKSRYTDGQIVKALKEEEVNGRPVTVISRELGINKQSFYNWKNKYAGMIGEQHVSSNNLK